jgi:hypothetical protein
MRLIVARFNWETKVAELPAKYQDPDWMLLTGIEVKVDEEGNQVIDHGQYIFTDHEYFDLHEHLRIDKVVHKSDKDAKGAPRRIELYLTGIAEFLGMVMKDRLVRMGADPEGRP